MLFTCEILVCNCHIFMFSCICFSSYGVVLWIQRKKINIHKHHIFFNSNGQLQRTYKHM